jgi:multidrug resistance efflux pump
MPAIRAKLNLSYTTVTAAQAGRVVNLGGAAGQCYHGADAGRRHQAPAYLIIPDDDQ